MSRYVQACAWTHVLTQVWWQAESRPKVVPGAAVQATSVRGKTTSVRGMTPGGDAAVRRALAADLLKLPEGLAGRPAPVSLTRGKKLLRALQRRLGARRAGVFRLV